jgi:hypothetical protein
MTRNLFSPYRRAVFRSRMSLRLPVLPKHECRLDNVSLRNGVDAASYKPSENLGLVDGANVGQNGLQLNALALLEVGFRHRFVDHGKRVASRPSCKFATCSDTRSNPATRLGTANLMTKNEARRITANIVKLPELLGASLREGGNPLVQRRL